MPRHKRIDFPGVIHHVLARGIERRKIFLNDSDYEEFLTRLERALAQTECRCYAWALMPNHFHLVIRTGRKSLSDMMRRLLTSYAIYFNKRYRRSGYVFQNRYKSILCQEDAYFLELIRYVHLNPVRAKIVTTLKKLDSYRLTGHATLVGKQKRSWQETGEVLVRYASKHRVAMRLYRHFIQSGFTMGKREDLIGGGLRRSMNGWEGVGELKRAKQYWRGDERILGDSSFVEQILDQAEEKYEKRTALKRAGWDLERLVRHVCALTEMTPAELRQKGRANHISRAKGLIAYWGYEELGLKAVDLARYFGVSQPAISRNIRQGKDFAKEMDLKLLN